MGATIAYSKGWEGENRFIKKANDGDRYEERLKQTMKTRGEVSELENFMTCFRQVECAVDEVVWPYQEPGREMIAMKGDQFCLPSLGGAVCGVAYTEK